MQNSQLSCPGDSIFLQDLIAIRAQLSPAHAESILNTQMNFRQGKKLLYIIFESSRSHGDCIHMKTLGVLHMRPLQLWHRARGFHLRANPQSHKGYELRVSYPLYVVQTLVTDFGSHSRHVLLLQDANDRHFPYGLGCGVR